MPFSLDDYDEEHLLHVLDLALKSVVELAKSCCRANPSRWSSREFSGLYAHVCDLSGKLELRLEEIEIEEFEEERRNSTATYSGERYLATREGRHRLQIVENSSKKGSNR